MGISAVTTLSFLVLWAAVLFDVWRTDHRFVRQGPKWCWMIFVAALPILGAAAWMLFGRPFFTVRRDPVADLQAERVVGPEDSEDWGKFLRFESIMKEVDRLD